MIAPTIISIESFGDKTILKLDEAPAEIAGMGDNGPLDVTPIDTPDLQLRGETLLKRLKENPAVEDGIEYLLQRTVGDEPSALYLRLRTTAAEPLLWETLFAQGYGFCALDPRWPIARMASKENPGPRRTYHGGLRITAVLAAAQVDATQQLGLFTELADHPRAAEVGLHITLITGDTALHDAVPDRPNLMAELIENTGAKLRDQIAGAEPDIVHFMGHGGETAGVASIAFASFQDVDTDAAIGSVRLKRNDLQECLAASNAWLAVLNACSSADSAASDTSSLAHTLARDGLPAVIGMRRLVDVNATNEFCRRLYPSVVETVADALAAPDGDEASIDWAAVLTDARVALAGNDPAASDAWTDPVMYTQRPPFQFIITPSTQAAVDVAELEGSLAFFEGALIQMEESGGRPQLVGELETTIDGLRAQLDDIKL